MLLDIQPRLLTVLIFLGVLVGNLQIERFLELGITARPRPANPAQVFLESWRPGSLRLIHLQTARR